MPNLLPDLLFLPGSTMPHSLVFNFLPQSPIPPGFTAGKALHGLFLNLVSSVDPDLGTKLHGNEAQKAFSLSPLQLERGSGLRSRPIPKKPTKPHYTLTYSHQNPIEAGQGCWWRVTLLDDRLFGHLSPLWLNLNPRQPWHLGPSDLHIISVLGSAHSDHPWADFASYGELYDRASDSARSLTLQFCTPMAFRQGRFDSALPTPEAVFGSLLRRWNHYSDRPLDAAIVAAVQPSAFEVRTVVVTDPRSQFQEMGARVNSCNQFVGCVGQVRYQVLGPQDPEVVKQLNTLADFAMFGGVGRKTTMGMGIVRRL